MDKFLIRKADTTGNKQPNSPTVSNTSENKPFNSDVVISKDLSVIAAIGKNIIQHKLPVYPKNKENRSFQAEWFQKCPWLEYSKKADAAFCYPCRQFRPLGSKENAFTSTGFRNWKMALSKEKGFEKHATSEVHITALMMWHEKEKRQQESLSVSTLINNDVLERHRYYIKSIAEVIQFLAINELAFRGTYDIDNHQENSLFLRLFEYTLQKDEKLAECFKHISANATYLSPEIQNTLIDIMAGMVSESVVNDIRNADVPWFSILEDGTHDKNNRENIAIGVRYIIDGKIKESILTIKTCTNLDAHSFTDLTLKVLNDYGLDSSKILSQCYDGAAVMSGEKGGVQALLQRRLNITIPYVHCCNHRLHLVLVKAIKEIPEIKQYFDQCSMLYMFLKRGSISKFYDGNALCRLLEQRWSGHLDVTRIIFNNYEKIIDALEKVSKSKVIDGVYVVEGIGLLKIVSSKRFRFSMVFMKKILETVQPADKLLQAHEASLKDSVVVLSSVVESLNSFRDENVYKEIDTKINTDFNIVDEEIPNKRKRKSNTMLKGYLILDKIGQSSEDVDQNDQQFRTIFYTTLDVILSEMRRRFVENDELLIAVSSAEEDNIDLDKVKYLQTLGIKLPSSEEIAVVNRFIQTQKKEHSNFSVFDIIFKQRVAFADTYNLLATAKTFGCSTATCESTFSVLTRINRPQRLSMCHQRMSNLTLLAFEQSRTKTLDFNVHLRKFNDEKDRRLQLF